MTGPFAAGLAQVTRLAGVRGALLVEREDGLVVAEALMEDLDGSAVAALAASLWTRLGRAGEVAGRGAPAFAQLEAELGTMLAVPAGPELLLVAVAEPDANLGMVRLELVRAAAGLA
jgi:predicted regulator of Ras-like GTPase activity (Roadblock/LC7/MglB family)